MKRANAVLILSALVCLFLMQRGGLILYGYSNISHPGIDEPVSGVLPCDILDGQIRAPLFTYEYMNRSGDVLLEGLLLVPYFKFLGRSIFSIKVFALSSALLALLCWIIFIKKYQGLPTAIIFCILYALPPPLFARLNVIGTNSSHHMVAPLIILQSILLFRILENRKGQNASHRVWLLSGFVAGFGVYIFYTYIIFLGFCVLFFLLFNRKPLCVRSIIVFAFGAAAGFTPWVIRSIFSDAGGQFLTSMVKNISIDFWSFVQNFGFAVPHSFGYNYPFRAVGFVSVCFWLFILFCTSIIIKYFIGNLSYERGALIRKRLGAVPLSCVHGLFCALFPLFFLTCLSLSPMHINPFEYWPKVGLFATFGADDAIRYRWLYILFPFYFASVAIGMAIFLNSMKKTRIRKVMIISLFVFFILCGAWKNIQLCSANDFLKIFYYKGYHYDLFAHKFILRGFSPPDIKTALSIAQNYPEANKREAYNFLGTLLAARAIAGKEKILTIEETLKKVPPLYISQVVCGIVRLANNVPEQDFQPLKSLLIQQHTDLFYKNWGFQYLIHKYYGLLINQKALFENIPSVEQWFYSNFLNKFKQETTEYKRGDSFDALTEELSKIPEKYQNAVAQGLGMRVGALMLFDTRHAPDYPLDSRCGEHFPALQREAFYEGVGRGFAETMCRFWRMLQVPENATETERNKLLDIEWNRCQSLMERLSRSTSAFVTRGFAKELQERYLPIYIRTYLNTKLNAQA